MLPYGVTTRRKLRISPSGSFSADLFRCLSAAATFCDRLQGFSVQGQIGSSTDDLESYINKCVYVDGQGTDSSSQLDGFVMEGLNIENCGCVRVCVFGGSRPLS